MSYGTRVAQHYLRRYPERVRALVLDGVVPPPLALGPDVAREAQRALEQIFARCAADAQCGARFAALPQLFAEVLARLDAGAADETDPPPISALELRTLVRFMSYSAATVALLPVLISEAHAGNYAPLAGQARTLLRELPESLSFPDEQLRDLHRRRAVRRRRLRRAASMPRTWAPAIMDALRPDLRAAGPSARSMPTSRRPSSATRPCCCCPASTIPSRRPPTPSASRPTGLRNSVHLVGRGQGHGLVGVGCVPRLLRSFLETPDPGRPRRELPRARAADAVLLELARARAMIEVDGISKSFGAVRAARRRELQGQRTGGSRGCSGRTAPANRRACGSSRRCSKPDAGAARVGGIDLAAVAARGPPHARRAAAQLGALSAAHGPREHRVLRAAARPRRGAARSARRRA